MKNFSGIRRGIAFDDLELNISADRYYMAMYIMLTISVILTAIVNNCNNQGGLSRQPLGRFKKVSSNKVR